MEFFRAGRVYRFQFGMQRFRPVFVGECRLFVPKSFVFPTWAN